MPRSGEYTPRSTTEQRAVFLDNHARRAIRESEEGTLPSDWRDRTKYELSSCVHTVCTIIEVENAHGVWGVEICNNCGAQTTRECAHVSNTWDEHGIVLTCDNCGIDGT